jgi:membrane associated rhomboid family serine protease
MLEPVLGHVRFAAVYFASLLAGSLGAIVAEPTTLTLGASGAVFGLMAATFALERSRGVDPRQSGILPLIAINLVLGFVIPHVAIGGHIGGLIGGGIAGVVIARTGGRRGVLVPLAVCVVIGAASVAGAIAFSDHKAHQLRIPTQSAISTSPAGASGSRSG